MNNAHIDQKAFVQKVIKETGCTYEQAMFVLGHTLELTQMAYMQGYNNATDQSSDEDQKRQTIIRLQELCEQNHDMCNEECPVYAVNGEVPLDPEHPDNCLCFKSGVKMYHYLKSRGQLL